MNSNSKLPIRENPPDAAKTLEPGPDEERAAVKHKEDTPDASGASSRDPEVRSLSTPAGEPYNDIRRS